jgi:hypothetical protein
MIRDHPWLGVGPGNFGRHYPRYMSPVASEKVQDPHNFALEIWATSGIVALLALLVSLYQFFRRMVVHKGSGIKDQGSVKNEGARMNDERNSMHADLSFILPPSSLYWYVAGISGFALAFLLRAADASADEMVLDGVISLGRLFVWLAAFAVLYRVGASPRLQAVAISAGVAALLLNLLVSGGIAQPSLAQPLWAMVALGLNARALVSTKTDLTARRGDKETRKQGEARPSGKRGLSPGLLVSLSPCLVLLVLVVTYFTKVFSPVTNCQAILREAREQTTLLEASDTIRSLEQARAADRGDAAPASELAFWYGQEWRLLPRHSELWEKGMAQARQAQQLDPDGKDGFLAECRLWELRAQYSRAATALAAVVARDPSEASLHYRLAEVLFRADEPVRALDEAQMAQRLDEQATSPERRLTDPQRQQVRTWIESRSKG